MLPMLHPLVITLIDSHHKEISDHYRESGKLRISNNCINLDYIPPILYECMHVYVIQSLGK